MAIKRIDPKATFRLISTSDAAIDLEASPSFIDPDLKEQQEKLLAANPGFAKDIPVPGKKLKYVDSHDLADLVMKPGMYPTVFVVKNLLASKKMELWAKHLTTDTVNKTTSIGNMGALFIELFDECVMSAEETVEEKIGEEIKTKVVSSKITADELELEVLQEVGAMIFSRSAVGDKLKKA